jgi:hypothetical protein
LRYRLEAGDSLEQLVLQPPSGEARPLIREGSSEDHGYAVAIHQRPNGTVINYELTGEAGVYRLSATGGRMVYFVAQPDPRESDLTPCTQLDRDKVSRLLPVTYENDREHVATALQGSEQKMDLWWWFLLGVVLLLCSEVWMTRRIAKGR